MGKHKSEDYKLTAVKYYNHNKNQVIVYFVKK